MNNPFDPKDPFDLVTTWHAIEPLLVYQTLVGVLLGLIIGAVFFQHLADRRGSPNSLPEE